MPQLIVALLLAVSAFAQFPANGIGGGRGFTAPSGYTWTLTAATTDTKTAATHGQGTMPDVTCWLASTGEKVNAQILNPSFLGDITVNFGSAFTGTCRIAGPGVNAGAAGDVVGPAGATAGALAFYSGVSGKVITGNAALCADNASTRIGVGTCAPGDGIEVAGKGIRLQGTAVDPSYYTTLISSYANPPVFTLSQNSVAINTVMMQVTRAATVAFPNGNVLVGGSTNGNFKFDIQASGTTGTLRVYDQGGAGSTLAVIQAGASQSGNLLSVRDNSGTSMFYVDAGGSAYSINNLGAVSGGVIKATIEGTTGLRIASDIGVKFSSTTVFNGTPDSGIARNAAGVIEGNNGTAGTLRDFLARQYRNTPVAVTSLQTCNAGNKGSSASVNDALAPAWGATVANGGAAYALVTCNGTNWTVIGI